MAARKAWAEYSRAYRQRLEKHGINESNYRTASRTKARGHEFTPERPSQIIGKDRISPSHVEYANNYNRLERAAMRKKSRMFGSTLKWNKQRADDNIRRNPQTKKAPTIAQLRRFLDMDMDEFIDIDWSDDDWAFLFYH